MILSNGTFLTVAIVTLGYSPRTEGFSTRSYLAIVRSFQPDSFQAKLLEHKQF